MRHSRFSALHCRATVAIKSSASNPSWRIVVTPKAVRISSIIGTWACKSSGVFWRVALYSGYISCLKVGVLESKAATMCFTSFF